MGSRLSSLRLTRSSWSAWGASLRRCWTADCSTPSTARSDHGYVASLASVTEHGGTLYVLCFSDDGPDTGPHPVTSGRAESGVQPQQWMECRRHRTGPDSDEIPRRRRTGLVRDYQTDLDCGALRTDERSRGVLVEALTGREKHADGERIRKAIARVTFGD